MKLQFSWDRPYKSISGGVTEDDLPSLTVITGLNGAGKTHLLEAIRFGAFKIVPDEIRDEDIRYVSFGDLTKYAELTPNHQRVEDFHNSLQQAIAGARESSGLDELTTDPGFIHDNIRTFLLSSERVSSLAVRLLEERMGEKLYQELTVDDIQLMVPQILPRQDVFELALRNTFSSYCVSRKENRFRRFEVELEGREVEPGPLTDEEFVDTYGPPPWDTLNQALAVMGLQLRFEEPDDRQGANVLAVLRDLETNARTRMENLSSGERTLLSIAMALYAASTPMAAVPLPKVLLLDEPDATLHPSMTRSLLTLLRGVLVDEAGVTVMMTTHSPTTVALAPEESLYTMRKAVDSRLAKSSTDEALRVLCYGLPTLSVSLDARRQVFVEALADEQCYTGLYSAVRSRLSEPYSLQFIAAGSRTGGGADAVTRLVNELRKNGNTGVYGLIDRDDRSGPGDDDFVLFSDERRCLENLVLDPLAIGVLLMQEGIRIGGVEQPRRFWELEAAHWQQVCDDIVGRLGLSSGDIRVVSYLAGQSIRVDAAVLEMDGHALEDLYLAKLKELGRFKNDLKGNVIERVYAVVPELTPGSAIGLFEQLGRIAEPRSGTTPD